eukprot:CAMPEP_0197848316 /NCGR_PEP_ID=MMETSP1438-20131217/8258_1 /TAXON_ID=1461541 /ORGANISM="Pterosperma sp., Strain CCMP1384" /LENGTH=204 /DNA_ID=CAMNT_0043460489 /DNA_START=146 /DNA_END=760 /DNA_ORIENTATION=+
MKGVQYEFKAVMPPKETHSPEFLKLNPSATVPVLVDDDFVLSESHAILTYLCNKYQWTDLYPTDLQRRAKVDHYLNWHHTNTRNISMTLFVEVFRPDLITYKDKDAAIQKLKPVLAIIEGWLTEHKYITGSQLTIADLSAYAEIGQLTSSFLTLADYSAYPNLCKWISHMQTQPGHDSSHKGLLKLKGFAEKRKAKLNIIPAKL